MSEIPEDVPGAAFPRAIRLRRSLDFARVQRGGRRIHLRHLVVLFLANGASGPRFGLVVSRKVGNAVVRNRVKRWLRESLRHARSGAGLEGTDVVLIARSSAAVAGYLALYGEVADGLRQIAQHGGGSTGRERA